MDSTLPPDDNKVLVVGFLFSKDLKKVALIKKNKPAWQAGRLNGVGGKAKVGENVYAAMCREFREETGESVEAWRRYFVLNVPDICEVHFFKAFGDFSLVSTTDEEVIWVPLHEIEAPLDGEPTVLPNLKWLIPMALDPDGPWGSANNSVDSVV